MDLQFPDLHRSRFNWQKSLWIATAVIGVAGAGLYLYRDARDSFRPAEGSLRVNINTATQEELESIPGIGPARAILIIAGRPYAKVEDLVRVHGIGRGTVESIRPYVKVRGETEKL